MLTPPEPSFLRARSQILFISVQLYPLLLLAPIFFLVSPAIASSSVAGVPLSQLLIASAVFGPLLTQSVSGPVFRSLDRIPAGDARGISAATLRSMPSALLVSAPFVLMVAWALSAIMHTGSNGYVALVGLLEVNMLFAASLVPAFSLRSGSLLALGWTSYGAALYYFPTVWWAPAIAGFLSQLIIAAIQSRLKLRGASLASARAMALGAIRGIAAALPLWGLPIALFLQEPSRFASGIVFVALVPALIANHIYFSTVAIPIWRTLDRVRGLLATRPYREAQADVIGVARKARFGEWRVIAVVLGSIGVTAPFVAIELPTETRFIVALVVASGLSVIVMAQVCRLSMLRTAASTYLVAAVLGLTMMASIVFGLNTVQLLVAYAFACLACSAVVSAANRRVWHRPEHALFWRTALSQ